MEWSQFVPPQQILILYVAFSILRFENQRWIRSIASGRTGASALVPAFVNITGFLGLLVLIGTLGLIFWSAGWRPGLGLMLISFLAGLISSAVFALLFRGDSFVIWLLATLAMWPVGYLLIATTASSYL